MRRGTKPRWQREPAPQPTNAREREQQEKCRAKAKRSFPTKRRAKLYCTRASIDIRPYRCNWCGEWHVTSQKADGSRG